jgi:CheY-like chemotaxis protein
VSRREFVVSKEILIVDDEPDIRLVTRLELTDWGFSVREARNGEEALELLEDWVPNAMLLDLRMPGIGGWGVIEQLASSGRLEEVPVLIFSAHLDAGSWEKASALGCKGFVPKPYEAVQLKEAVESLVAPQTATGP